MGELLAKSGWLLIAAIHTPPALVAFLPTMAERLYGTSPQGDVGLLLTHRGVLFLVVAVGCLVALFDPQARRLMSVLSGISIVGFLVLYARAGLPSGALRGIALADVLALAALAVVSWEAWRVPTS